MSSGHPRVDAADRRTPVKQLPDSPGGYGEFPFKASYLNDRHHSNINEYSIFEHNARFFERNLSIDATISEYYNSLTSQCAFVLRRLSGLSVDSNEWKHLRVKLSDLLTEMEAAAQEVCPENVEHIRNFSQLMFHPQQQAVAFSAVSSEVAKRGQGRPRKPAEITGLLVSLPPVKGHNGLPLSFDEPDVPPAPKPSGKRGRRADPDGTINRLAQAYLDSVHALSKMALDDPHAIPVARRLVRSRERLGARGFDTARLGHDDYLKAARRILKTKNGEPERSSAAIAAPGKGHPALR